MLVLGTRPEAIKMAPVYHRLSRSYHVEICLTAQHRQLLDQVMTFFGMRADYDLDIMSANQSLTQITTRVLEGLEDCFNKAKPDFVFVHGDTTTAFSASLAAFYRRIPVCHVEAGLRTGNNGNPFPEEMNRRLTGSLADFHFAPTAGGRENLLREGVPADRIFVTGNTAIDALHATIANLVDDPIKSLFRPNHRKILITAHRRENFGKGIANLCRSVNDIIKRLGDAHVVYPVHFNPNVRTSVNSALRGNPAVTLTDPMSYPEFVQNLSTADLIITDSGGVQEEAPSLGKPVLVLRDYTERPEAVTAGTVALVGTDHHRITGKAVSLLTNRGMYDAMARAINPYGDGRAAERIGSFMEFVMGFCRRNAVLEPFADT